MSGTELRETIGLVAIVAGLVFVGIEVRQNTRATEAAALQDLGLALQDHWREVSFERELTELRILAKDSLRWDEIDEVEWEQLASIMIAGQRGRETLFLLVRNGSLPDEALEILGNSGDATRYWGDAAQRLWSYARPMIGEEYASFVEASRGSGS